MVGSWYSTLNDDKNLSQVGVDINVDVCAERERERGRVTTLRFGLLKLVPKLEVPVVSSL